MELLRDNKLKAKEVEEMGDMMGVKEAIREESSDIKSKWKSLVKKMRESVREW